MAKKKYVDEFYLTNIKTHDKLEGKVNGRHFALVGPNGAGKTTGFQVIRRLIAALPDAEKPEVWLKKGKDAGEMRVVLANNGDKYLVSEKISSTPGSRSRIRLWKINEDGTRDELTPAQTRLTELFGNVMDLTPLMEMPGKEQFAYLKDKLNFPTAEYETNREKLLDARKKETGKKTLLKAMISDTHNAVTDDEIKTYAAEKDVEKVLAKKIKIEPIKETVKELNKEIDALVVKEKRVLEIDEQIKKLQQEKLELGKVIKTAPALNKKLDVYNKEVERAESVNLEVDEEVKTLVEHNTKHNKVKYHLQKKGELEAVEVSITGVNKQIKDLDKIFFDALAAIPFGEVYPTLKLVYVPADKENDKEEQIGLFLDELPFHRKQLSYGVMIKCLIKLSVFLNPEGLNFVYIADWDLLDKNNKNDLIKFAEEQENVQLGIEKVDDLPEIEMQFIDIK